MQGSTFDFSTIRHKPQIAAEKRVHFRRNRVAVTKDRFGTVKLLRCFDSGA